MLPPIAPPRKSKKPIPNMPKEPLRLSDSPLDVHNISGDSGISRSPAQFSNNSSVVQGSLERRMAHGSSLPSSGASSSLDVIPPAAKSSLKWKLGELFKRVSPESAKSPGAIPSWKEKIEDSKFKEEVQRSVLGTTSNEETTSEEEEEDDGIIMEDFEKDSMLRASSVGCLSNKCTYEAYRKFVDRVPPPPPPRDPKRRLYLLQQQQHRPISYSFENISSAVKDPEDLGLPPVWNNRPTRLIYTPPSHAYVSPSSSHYISSAAATKEETRESSTPPPVPPRKEEEAAMASANEFWKSPPFPFVPSNPPTLSSSSSTDSRRSNPSRPTGHQKDTLIPMNGSLKSGKLSPSSSISSKDSGCSEVGSKRPQKCEDKKSPPVLLSSSPPRSGDKDPGFSTKHRRSLFRDALFELEAVFDDIQKDEDLLDRAERRDLPTAHQELRSRPREMSSNSATDETAFSDMDNFMNWNTSSSFENLSPVRARTPGNRRSGVIDKKTDDMAYRKARDNNKLPNTETGKSEHSYLLLSSAAALSPKGSLLQLDRESGRDEPDTLFDDVLFRNIRDANANVQPEPQPKFGIPVGPVSGASETDYLHAVPEGKYRSTFHAMRNPDLVLDDLALRRLRKDGNLSDPNHLGIVKEPHITYHSCWKHKMLERQKSAPSEDVFYPDKHNPIMVALSKDIAEIIKKQSGIASAGDEDEIVTYDQLQLTGLDVSRPAVQQAVEERREMNPEWSGQTVYSLLSSGDTRDIQDQLQDVVDTIDRDLELCQKTREVDVDGETEENSVVEPVPLFNNSEETSESSSLSKNSSSSLMEDKDRLCQSGVVPNDFLSVVVPAVSKPQPIRRRCRPSLEASSCLKMPSEKKDLRLRLKEERRRGLSSNTTGCSSSSDEEDASHHESYSRYRRRKKRKNVVVPPGGPGNGSSSERSSYRRHRGIHNRSPEHIYHSIDSVMSGGTRSKSSEIYQDPNLVSLNQSTSSLKARHSRASLSPSDNTTEPHLLKRKSLLNTSYSSEEILIQAVNSLHGLGDELKVSSSVSSSTSSSSPQTPGSTLGSQGGAVSGSKTLSSPDIVKSLSKTLTPPISPHHRPSYSPNEPVGSSKNELISDPLLEHWPGRPKKHSAEPKKSPTTSPSTASKPPIFPLLSNGASSAPGLKLVSLRKPSESFLSRRPPASESSSNDTPQFVKEFRRRSGGFNPNEVVLGPPSRPQSAVILRKDSGSGGVVKFDEREVLKTCEDFIRDYDDRRQSSPPPPPVPMPRESLLKRREEDEPPSPRAMRNRSSSLTIHDKAASSCIFPKPILKKSSEDLLKEGGGILKRKSSEYEHIRIRSPEEFEGIRPILRSRNSSVCEDLQSILKRSSLDDEDSLYEIHSSSTENISPQGILKRRFSSSMSLEGILAEDDAPTSILKKQQGSMEELLAVDVVKSILKKKGASTDDELEPGEDNNSSHTPKSILKSRKSEESLSPLTADEHSNHRRVSLEQPEEHGIRPILKRKESREELLLAVSHRLTERSFRSPELETKSILVRPRPSSLGSPREESAELPRAEYNSQLNRLRRAESEVVRSSSPPSRSSVYVSLSESRRTSSSSSNPKRSSSLRSVNDLNKEDDKVEKGCLSFGGAVVFGSGKDSTEQSKRRSSQLGSSDGGNPGLKKEEPSGILKRRSSRNKESTPCPPSEMSISQSAPSSTSSTPRKSILKHDSLESSNPPPISSSSHHHHHQEQSSVQQQPCSSGSMSRKLKGVLKKDSSYEETLKPILKNIPKESLPSSLGGGGDLELSVSSCSSEDIVRTFNDVIIDPVPDGGGRRSEEEEEAFRPFKTSSAEAIPPSSVNISADGDLASKLQQLAVKAIKQKQQVEEATAGKDPSTSRRSSIPKAPFNPNKCVKKSASFRETSSRVPSSSVHSSSNRSLTTDVSADEYYQIFKQTKRTTSESSNDSSSKMREIVEKENSVPKRPKPEIKVNGGGIADRLAALKKNGEEGWKKKVQKMDVIENVSPPSANKKKQSDFRPGSLTDRVSQLQSSQNNWQVKVGEKDAKKFTVAGKMSRFGYNSSGDSGDDDRIRSTPKLRSFGSPKLNSPRPRSTCCIMDDTNIISSPVRKLSHPVSRSKSSVEARRVVQVPSTLDEDFTNFYGKIDPSDDVPVDETDLDEVLGEFKPLAAVKKARGPTNKRKPTSGNPIKKLAARKDIQQNYTEHMSVATETPTKGSKHAHLAAEALAGLASKEDFSSVQLKRGNTAVPNQDMIPYKELMLLQIKGRRHCQTRLVAPRASSINSGDCYVLVTPSEVYNWVGCFSNVIERSRSAEVALHIQSTHDLGFKGSSKVITVEDPSHNRKFWGSLLSGGEEDDSPSEAGPSEEDELYEAKVNEFNLVWEVSEEDGTLIPVQEFWGTVPKYCLLHPDKVLVLDFGSELYLWSGKTAGFELRKAGAQSVKELWDTGYEFEESSVNPVLGANVPSKAPERPSWCILGRVNSHMETVLFREKFQDWPQDESSRIIKSKNNEDEQRVKRLITLKSTNIDLPERSIFDIESFDAHDIAAFPLEDPDMELENSHLGRGTGYYDALERRNYEIETLDIAIWYVQEFDVTPLNLEEWKAQFHFEDAYIVRWKYKVSLTGRDLKGNPSKHSAVGRERVAFFFWQGVESGVSEKGASALKTVELDRERGPQIRVDQGKEEAAFLNLWQGEMMIHFGKRNRASEAPHRLYVVRGVVPQETHLVEVEPAVSSLRSLGTFVLFSPGPGQINIWHGEHSPSVSRQLAEAFVARFKERPSTELGFKQGQPILVSEETHVGGPLLSGPLFEALGSSSNELFFPLSRGLAASPRLYRMTSVSGRFLVNEVLCPHRKVESLYSMPFNQGDLYISEQPALFLLDVGHKLWLWQGWWPEWEGGSDGYKDGSVRWHSERRAAMQTAVDLWTISHRDSELLAELVWAGFESREFINLFPFWRHVEEAKVLNQSFVGNSNMKSVLSSLSRMEYSWEDLCKRPLPDGVDPSRLEKYLNDQEFKAHLGLSKEDFQSAPKWKQIEIRKEKGLF